MLEWQGHLRKGQVRDRPEDRAKDYDWGMAEIIDKEVVQRLKRQVNPNNLVMDKVVLEKIAPIKDSSDKTCKIEKHIKNMQTSNGFR